MEQTQPVRRPPDQAVASLAAGGMEPGVNPVTAPANFCRDERLAGAPSRFAVGLKRCTGDWVDAQSVGIASRRLDVHLYRQAAA